MTKLVKIDQRQKAVLLAIKSHLDFMNTLLDDLDKARESDEARKAFIDKYKKKE